MALTEEQLVELITALEDFVEEREREGDRLGVTHLGAANFATGQAAGAQFAIDRIRRLT